MLKKMVDIKSTEDGILVRLFRKILIETGFINSITYFISRYKGSKSKSTISKLVLDGEITWKSFTFLLITILQARKIVIDFTINIDDNDTTSSITVSPDEYSEKEAGKYLVEVFNNIVKELKLENKLNDLMTDYNKRGGKKNKATIGKIITADTMSWKSFVFLIFELLRSKYLIIKITFTNLVNKTSIHEIKITKVKEKKDEQK